MKRTDILFVDQRCKSTFGMLPDREAHFMIIIRLCFFLGVSEFAKNMKDLENESVHE